ncbi:MAG TPA: peptidylprolyl isomerase [Actinomycetota bacterium]|nr:peptidylprolyl isomerase [Actinomycetota bacterium]
MSKKSHHRRLARQAARRQAERRRRRRQRAVVIGVSIAVALGGIGLAVFAFTRSGGTGATASGTPTPSATGATRTTVDPSPGPKAVACGATAPKNATTPKPQFASPPKMSIDRSATYLATLHTSCGTIVIRLDPKSAPNTVNSIVFLARKGFFDGTRFHRIARNFVIQGGDPTGTGSGGPGYSTLDVPPANAKYPIGTVAMAKTGQDPAGTAGSQFFIVTSASAQAALAPGGKGQYAIVGHVISGMDVVRKIAALPIQGGSSDGPPAQSVYIDRMTISVKK